MGLDEKPISLQYKLLVILGGITVIERNGTEQAGLIPGMGIKQLCFPKSDALDDELRSFVRAVTTYKTPEVTARMGRDALKIALNIMEQINNSSIRFFE